MESGKNSSDNLTQLELSVCRLLVAQETLLMQTEKR